MVGWVARGDAEEFMDSKIKYFKITKILFYSKFIFRFLNLLHENG